MLRWAKKRPNMGCFTRHGCWKHLETTFQYISWIEPEEYWSSLFRRLSDLSFCKPLFLRAAKKAGQNLYRTFLQTHHSISPCFGWVMLGLSPFVLLKNSEATQIRSIPTYHLTWQLHWPTAAPMVHARHCHWHWVWWLGSCRWGQCISPQSSALGWWLIIRWSWCMIYHDILWWSWWSWYIIMMIIVISAGAHLHMLSDEWWGAQGGVGEKGRCDSESYWIIIIYIYIYFIYI